MIFSIESSKRISPELAFVSAAAAVLSLLAGLVLLSSAPAHADGLCGDYNSDGGGGCYDPQNPRPGGEVSITANPSSIYIGNASLLSWQREGYQGDANCTVLPTVGNVARTGGGSATVYPTQTTTYQYVCYTAWGYSADASVTVTVSPYPPPTAALSANPTSVIQGGSSILTWSSTNATSCTGTNFSTGGATSGSVTVAPAATTNYSMSCTGSGGTANAFTSVTVIPLLAGSCSVSPTAITTGGSATWTASASGGTGSYSYSWSGTESLAGTGSSVSKSYSSAGVKSASIAITSGTQSNTFSCSNTVTATDAPPPPPPPPSPPTSCTVDNANPTVGATVTYTVSGGSSPYSWTPSGGSGSGTGSTRAQTYSVQGPYTMQVSGNGSSPINCPVVTAGPVSCGTAHVDIAASPLRVRKGQTSTVTWSASGVDGSCTISGPGVSQTVPASSCTIPNGTATPTINAQSVYTINCDSGEATDQAVVNLIPSFIEF